MKKSGGDSVPVSERALAQRINRTLKHERLVKLRGRAAVKLGTYVIVRSDGKAGQGGVQRRISNLEAFARELGVLAAYEELSE
jgi:hypothetical protein